MKCFPVQLYQLSEASRIFEQLNGDLNSLDNNIKADPWGSTTAKSSDSSIPLDFDPWKSSGNIETSKTVMNSSTPDMWQSGHSRNIIDDIFGDDSSFYFKKFKTKSFYTYLTDTKIDFCDMT